jgi:hypothetical protein
MLNIMLRRLVAALAVVAGLFASPAPASAILYDGHAGLGCVRLPPQPNRPRIGPKCPTHAGTRAFIPAAVAPSVGEAYACDSGVRLVTEDLGRSPVTRQGSRL